ncbi:MAG TPA: UDP-N-acetylmuramoyl-L-alanine--D-glutamate ligase [Candidatus Paceibacterota bacterium]
MDASAHFRGKKITVMGLGLLGRGIGDVRYLASNGAELTVTDLKSADILAPSVEALSDVPGITYVLGEHRLEDFRGRDLILKAAGVPLDSEYVAEARKEGTPVRMSADLFFEYAGIPAVGVTGTRGKTTTTYLVDAILKAAGKRTLLGGNVRGVSTLALLDKVDGGETAVLELDSWQLQGFGAAKLSPQVAVFTTFFPDHLNYYGGDTDAYLADKANIFLNQKPGDALILGAQCAELVRQKYGVQIRGKVVVADTGDIPSDWRLLVPGEHNRYDAACALASARALGIPDDVSRTAIESFTGVPGRLEFVKEHNGVKIYNDTTATTPEATLAALKALDDGSGNVILIMGGADKGLNMRELIDAIPLHAKRVIMLAGTGTSLVNMFLPDASVYGDLDHAVEEALLTAGAGDVILFSPAFASFGMFRNEYDRGDQFMSVLEARTRNPSA